MPRQGGSDAINTHGTRHRLDREAVSVLPGLETLACQGLAVPQEVMHHVVRIESSFNPYAIGVVGGRLARQPRTLAEALSTVRMLEQKGYNFSIGLAQVNRYNLEKYGLQSYERAFEPCANLVAGSRILAECYDRSGGDWGKSFSCYYSGNFSTGFRHGYVQKIYASIRQGREVDEETQNGEAIAVVGRESRKVMPATRHPLYDTSAARTDGAPYAGPVVETLPQLRASPVDESALDAETRRPSRVEAVVSRRVAIQPQTPAGQGGPLDADPAYVASRPAPAQEPSTVPAPAPAAEIAAPAAVAAAPEAQRPRGPVVLQPYSGRAPAAPPPAPAPRTSVPPVDRAARKSDEAFVF